MRMMMNKNLTSGFQFDRLKGIISRSPDGWWAEITPLTFNRARIIITDGGGVENGW